MKTYGLIGKSLGHSFSKSFFEEFFSKQNLSAQYLNFELSEIQEVADLLKKDISGLNVTIPYKESVIPFLSELSDEARSIGAVNCIEFKNGSTIGHNTDAYGFHQSVKPFLTNKHERAIILGTGGSSKAVIHVLKGIGIDIIQISRNPEGPKQFEYKDINEHMLKACKLIVNCTPVGMFPHSSECPDIPFKYLTEDHLVVDLIYNPPVSKFLEKSKSAGATILNGDSMLKLQAMRSWTIWNGQI